MPHFPKPFFRPSRSLWYVQLRGRQVNLGPDQEQAFTRYHELMTRPEPQLISTDMAVVIMDAFLDWCQQHREPRTYEWYKERCQGFSEAIPASLTVQQLKPFHVQQWVDSKNWNEGMKRGAIIAIQRVFNWAVRLGYIEKSPIAYAIACPSSITTTSGL
ncbi:MAG TPA: hypothetical protein VHD56_05160 [Tepidisphaeraceae bacterium]|nr:hypothetical protein [Tepidisphaeraceae bacterium]